MRFDVEVEKMLLREGGYVNDPKDSGGETNYGITVGVARAFGYTGSMREMPRSTAIAIYRTRYWDSLSLDTIERRAPSVAVKLFDIAVNMGAGRAAEFLQRTLNVLNDGGATYADLKVDGAVGPATLAAFDAYLDKRFAHGELVLTRALNALQGAYYIELAERRPKDERFVYGWLLNRVD